MNKKGQIYIIAAILLSVVIFALASVTNIAKQEKFKGDFEKLSSNYETEGSKLINTVVNTGEDVGARFGNFTYAFTSYSKTQNPQFGLIYVLDYGGRVYLGNYLKEDIYIDASGGPPFALEGCFEKVGASVTFGALTATFDTGKEEITKCVKEIPEPSSKKVYIAIKNSWYPFKLIEGKPTMMVVSQMEQEEQRKVFVGGEGFVKEEDHCASFNLDKCQYLADYGICEWDKEEQECKQNEDIDELMESLENVGMANP
ncbi:MAG: hypothetical protein ABIH63_02260 [archaeon]